MLKRGVGKAVANRPEIPAITEAAITATTNVSQTMNRCITTCR
ncbi:MAG TPA: hypothetical protein VLQ90_09290 [Pyrinomonadaceae bacterium]|nr:hypothetical protein [Pyrinomonadaceae bacterium]